MLILGIETNIPLGRFGKMQKNFVEEGRPVFEKCKKNFVEGNYRVGARFGGDGGAQTGGRLHGCSHVQMIIKC